jgi:hypothetical protein
MFLFAAGDEPYLAAGADGAAFAMSRIRRENVASARR